MTSDGLRQLALGFVLGLPLSIPFLGKREFLLLYTAIFVPYALVLIWKKKSIRFQLTSLDRLAMALLVWILVSVAVNLVMDIGLEHRIAPRLISLSAFFLYAALPYVVGRLAFRSGTDFALFARGFFVGAAVACLYLLIAYTAVYSVDPLLCRYEIGQRIPLVIGFALITHVFFAREKLGVFALIQTLFAFLLVASQTRSVFCSYLLTFIGSLIFLWKKAPASRWRWSVGAWILAFVVLGSQILGRYHLIYTGDAPDLTASGFFVSLAERFGIHDASAITRFKIWDHLLAQFDGVGRILFGFGQLGPGFVGDSFTTHYGLKVSRYSAHNEYLDWYVRTGAVGLVLYLILVGAIVRLCWIGLRRSPTLPIYPALLAALPGVLLSGFFHETTRYPWFGAVFWLWIGALSAFSPSQSPSAESSPS